MDGMLRPPTAFDMWTGVASAVLYLLVGLAALARAPGDARTRTFLVIAIASLAPYLLPSLPGRIGYGTMLTVATIATGASLAVGSIALFHFTQVFPLRRPWIQARAIWLVAAYAVLPLGGTIGALALLPIVRMIAAMEGAPGSGGLGAVSSDLAFLLLFVLIPVLFVIGIVLPFAALLSLYKSWQEAKKDGRDGARVTTLTILISQLAGGVLTILIVPLLHLLAPAGASVMIAAAMLFGFGLLFPIAFAVGVWKYELIGQT
jgi:hypothetical protein